MKPTMNVIVALLFIELLAIATINIDFCNGSSSTGCIESERHALLMFKQDLKDPSNRLASWTGDGDCCTWAGVVCDNFTGQVLELHLRNPLHPTDFRYLTDAEVEAYERSKFGGKVNSSILDLKHLIYLDLSNNDFEGIQIPKFLGSMKNLRYLNLSEAGFEGMIPPQLGNLSNLQYLDLRQIYSGSLYVDNLSWLSGLSLLEHLDLSNADLGNAPDSLSVINTLPSLAVLELSCCQIHRLPPLSIANFSSLETLVLSFNNFDSSLIPNWVFGLSRLVYLDLSASSFTGPIPDGLQNLTSLRHLDLSSNNFNCSIPNSLLYRLNHLEYLNLGFTHLQGRISNALGNKTSIKIFDLSNNFKLEGRIPRSFGSLCKLTSISLSYVNVSQDISEILDIFSGCVSNKLEILDLESSQISGTLTNQLGKFKKLDTLLLGNNSISGPIPWSLGDLSSLKYLDLSHNELNDSIPLSLGKLSSLVKLDISFNKFNGSLFPLHFVNLSRLRYFDASRSSLMLKASSDWIPPFQIEFLYLGSCHLGPQFPSWLHSQKVLAYLDVSNSKISDIIPSRFWEAPSLFSLNFSHNQIYGMIPNLTRAFQLYALDLSWNNCSGPLPRIPSDMRELDLSNNAFSGSIFNFLCHGMNESKATLVLKLENNSLFGELPDCWMNWTNLVLLNLNNNHFTGKLPDSMGTLSSLQSLHLHNNSFSGIIPMSLKSCTELIALDLGENEFVGNVPIWFGESFLKLMFLSLRSNKFHGPFPMELCRLASLQILDLSLNGLFGSIPGCISNFSDMVTINHSRANNIAYVYSYAKFIAEEALVVVKGRAVQYNTILNLVRIIDFSKNKFSGEIPKEVTNLKALQSLNLSHNFFTGRIPENIGAMRSLESVDFSVNQLYGKIPESMSRLTFLNYLNLSNNNLTGKIPLSTQLQSFDASSFIGNELCGPPLPKSCTAPVLEYKFVSVVRKCC